VPVEIESKFRVASHDPIRARLVSLGATRVGEVVELNRIYDRQDGELRKGGCGLRVRSFRSGSDGARRGTITFKGPIQPGRVKTREEIEVEVSDAAATAVLLKRLNFVTRLTYEKRRESWTLPPCKIELDTPPRIGFFVEIEGPDVASILHLQEKIGLPDQTHVRQSYVRMLWEYCDANNIMPRELYLNQEPGAAG